MSSRSWELDGFLESRKGHLYKNGVDAVELAREHADAPGDGARYG